MGAPAIVLSPRDRWLAERRKGVGASDLAAILGCDDHRGALAIYADKVADKASEDDLDYMTFGRDVEAAIARGYSRRTKRPIVHDGAFEIVRHADLPILGVTLDFEIEGSTEKPAPAEGVGVLETKAVGFHKRELWLEEPPLGYVVQVQAQMACRRRAWGSLGVLMGGISIAEPVDLTPNPEFMAVALEAVAVFWWHVENRRPPTADAKPGTRKAIRRLWPGAEGTAIALTREDITLVEEWEVAKLRKEQAEITYDGVVNQLAVRMGDAETGQLPDGSAFIYSVESCEAQMCRSGCGTVIRKAFTRRVPRRWWPKHLKPKKGTRT